MTFSRSVYPRNHQASIFEFLNRNYFFSFSVQHQNVTMFHDDSKFYWFVVDYSNPPLSVHQFIYNIISYSMFDEYDICPINTTPVK